MITAFDVVAHEADRIDAEGVQRCARCGAVLTNYSTAPYQAWAKWALIWNRGDVVRMDGLGHAVANMPRFNERNELIREPDTTPRCQPRGA